jgi:site-specific recombinase XerD
MATISVILFTSKVLRDGSHPIMLRVTENRKPKYIGLGYYATKEQWDLKKQRPNKKHPNKLELEMLIAKRLQDAEKLSMEGEVNNQRISPENLLSEVKNLKKITSFIDYGSEYCERLKQQGRIKTAKIYKEAVFKILRLLDKKVIAFQDITVPLLNKFEAELLKNGVSENSISVYMRALRAVYNRGLTEAVVKNLDSPFKVYKVSKLDNRTVKRAITKAQINSIVNLKLEPNSKIEFAKDVFLFSYYCRGMNFRDVALLKKENLQDDRIYYIRSKTGQNFSILLLPPALEILNRMKLVPNTGNYLFPILNDFHNTPQRIENRLTKIIRQVNKDLKEIADLAGINIPLTTYVARHTYATVLKKSGVSTSVISESMGHATEAITQTYLASFDNEVIDAADKWLL